MPTLDQLFGSGEKRAKVINLKAEGEFVKGVIKSIDAEAPVFEWDQSTNRPGPQKFWVDGKPKGVAKDEAERAGLRPVHQIMITIDVTATNVSGIEGEARLPINSKDERDKFKQAIIDNNGSIDVGDEIGKKLAKREGNRKTHDIKLTSPAS